MIIMKTVPTQSLRSGAWGFLGYEEHFEDKARGDPRLHLFGLRTVPFGLQKS